MSQFNKKRLSHYVVIAVTIVTALVMMHWSINTLLELASGTVFQFKHTLSIFILFLAARVLVSPRRFRPNRSREVNSRVASAG